VTGKDAVLDGSGKVPNPDGFVLAASRCPAAVWAESDGGYGGRMPAREHPIRLLCSKRFGLF